MSHRLEIEGDLTIYAAADLKEKLLAALAEETEIEVNLARVGEVDTAGVQLLILAKREAARLGKELHLTGHSPAVLEALDLIYLGGFFGDPVVIESRT